MERNGGRRRQFVTPRRLNERERGRQIERKRGKEREGDGKRKCGERKRERGGTEREREVGERALSTLKRNLFQRYFSKICFMTLSC